MASYICSLESDLRRMYVFKEIEPHNLQSPSHHLTFFDFLELFPKLDQDLGKS